MSRIDPHDDPHAHIVHTPLAPSDAGKSARNEYPNANAQARQAAHQALDEFMRPENEDDDGYDPYSDRPASPTAADLGADPWR